MSKVATLYQICNKCKQTKPVLDFSLSAKSNTSYCNLCQREYQRQYQKRYIKTDNGKRKVKNKYLKFKFKITIERFEELLKAQNYVCAICKNPNHTGKSLCVDHNHTTGTIRGLLCNNCNRAIGLLKDNTELINNALRYLNGA